MVAPTEILAAQHYKRIFEMLRPFEKRVGILTKGYSEFGGAKIKKEEMVRKIKEGEVKILIGTHSLFEEKIEFSKLALLIFDEQHKFGVEQRRKLLEKQKILPHFLSMTATPIPRTLALTIFGDLDISSLKELPYGKRRVEIEVVLPSEEKKIFEFIREKIKEGEQLCLPENRIFPKRKALFRS
jgi:ATP-dependent DNA helicase RecG